MISCYDVNQKQLYKSDVLAWHYYANWGVAALLVGGALNKRLEPALVIVALFFLATKPTRAPRARLLQYEVPLCSSS